MNFAHLVSERAMRQDRFWLPFPPLQGVADALMRVAAPVPASTFACGHARSPENSVYVLVHGKYETVRCRECKNAHQATYQSKRRAESSEVARVRGDALRQSVRVLALSLMPCGIKEIVQASGCGPVLVRDVVARLMAEKRVHRHMTSFEHGICYGYARATGVPAPDEAAMAEAKAALAVNAKRNRSKGGAHE